MDVLHIIQLLVAPVVMISACGLLCLAFYNRLAVVVNRIRAFNQERLAILDRLDGPAIETPRGDLRLRAEAIDRQVLEIMKRARLVRNTLVGLVVCIICMVVTSLCVGLSIWLPGMAYVALGVFVAGMLTLLGAMIVALMELQRSLQPVALDRDFMLRLDSLERGIVGVAQVE
jgi:hypothetical protein